MSMVINRIGRREVLLPFNHNHYNFQKKKTFIWSGFTILIIYIKKKFPILEIPSTVGYVVVDMVIVINSVTGGFN